MRGARWMVPLICLYIPQNGLTLPYTRCEKVIHCLWSLIHHCFLRPALFQDLLEVPKQRTCMKRAYGVFYEHILSRFRMRGIARRRVYSEVWFGPVQGFLFELSRCHFSGRLKCGQRTVLKPTGPPQVPSSPGLLPGCTPTCRPRLQCDLSHRSAARKWLNAAAWR